MPVSSNVTLKEVQNISTMNMFIPSEKNLAWRVIVYVTWHLHVVNSSSPAQFASFILKASVLMNST